MASCDLATTRKLTRHLLSCAVAAGVAGMAMDADASMPKRPLLRSASNYAAVTFADVPGWGNDQHAAAFSAFRISCERLIVLSRTESKVKASDALLNVCIKASQLAGSRSNAEARAFFEQNFVPHRVVHAAGKGLLTAYYEPIVPGSRTPSAKFPWPLYKRPPDLVNIVDEAHRGAVPGLTHARQTSKGLAPFATRQEIEQGALKGQGLELMYVEHAVDAFFMQIQGSARVKLPDGSLVRVGYDGKNGHPYTSIGRVLIDKGEIPVERMSLQALGGWLKANPATAREVMWANKSFVFFKEHTAKEAIGPQGVHDITLTPGRSLAVDPAHHALGSPVYVAAPEIKHIPPAPGAKPEGSLRKSAAAAKGAPAGLHRLMIAQDVGSAIKGPERGDIYVGTGDGAGKIAGITKHPGNFFVLLPRGETSKREPVAAVAGSTGATPPAKPVTAVPTVAPAPPVATSAASAPDPVKSIPPAAARSAPAATAASAAPPAPKPSAPPAASPAVVVPAAASVPPTTAPIATDKAGPARKPAAAKEPEPTVEDQLRTSLQ